MLSFSYNKIMSETDKQMQAEKIFFSGVLVLYFNAVFWEWEKIEFRLCLF